MKIKTKVRGGALQKDVAGGGGGDRGCG